MKTYVIDGTLQIEPETDEYQIEFELPDSGLKIKGLSKSLCTKKGFVLPKEHGIYILEGIDKCYIGQSKDLHTRIKNHNGTNKVEFTRGFILSKKDTDLRQYLDYMEAYTIQKMVSLGYELENFKRPCPDEDILAISKKQMTNGWINEFLLFLPILGFRKSQKKLIKDPLVKILPNSSTESIIEIEINGHIIREVTSKKVFNEFLNEVGLERILKKCPTIFDTSFKLTTTYEKHLYGTCKELIQNNQKYYLYLNISKQGLINKIYKIQKLLNLNLNIIQK